MIKIFSLASTLVALFIVSATAQRSHLYNANGKLYADTTLSISPAQLKSWAIVEEKILKDLAQKIKYPPVAFRNGLQGKIILGFDYSGDSISNIRFFTKKLGGDIETLVLQSVKENKNIISREFRSPTTTMEGVTITKGTYFIPIIFQNLNFEQEV